MQFYFLDSADGGATSLAEAARSIRRALTKRKGKAA